MKLTMVRKKDCDIGRQCPRVDHTDRGTTVIQGYTVDDAAMTAAGLTSRTGQIVIEVPLDLVPEYEVADHPALRPTGHGTVLVVGPALTDPVALAELDIPPGEAAVELPSAALPPLLEASHA